MDNVDDSEHYVTASNEPPPSLLTIILDTNPYAWALLSPTLPISKAVANILVFINAHLAFNNANKIAVIASHLQRAEFLYPQPAVDSEKSNGVPPIPNTNDDSDTEMADISSLNSRRTQTNGHPPPLAQSNTTAPSDDANVYRPFHQVAITLQRTLRHLLESTSPNTLRETTYTSLAGALTLALTYTSKQLTLVTPPPSTTGQIAPTPLVSRVLLITASPASATHYIPLMNTIFAAQRLRIPLDVAHLRGSPSLLQQAADATGGTYISLTHPQGLLQYLLFAYLPDATARKHLIAPTEREVDFRAACFCHRRVVDIGFVCSVCLSIFCEVPEERVCYTCGTALRLGDYGKKPVVRVVKKKKRDKKVEGGTPG